MFHQHLLFVCCWPVSRGIIPIPLSNTRARLKGLYGERGVLFVQAQKTGGFSAQIQVPWRTSFAPASVAAMMGRWRMATHSSRLEMAVMAVMAVRRGRQPGRANSGAKCGSALIPKLAAQAVAGEVIGTTAQGQRIGDGSRGPA
jgi:hypothetical protein